MRLFLLALPALCLGVARGQTCDNGLAGVSNGDFCCVLACGDECGGSGCSNRGGGLDGDDCCTANILAGGVMCADSNAAPCMGAAADVTPTPEPETTAFICSGDAGILSGDICCAAECGSCGGVGCSGRTGGAASCCTKDIDAAGESCSVKGASPCVVDGAAPVTPTPEPVDATPEPTPEETPEPEAPGGAFSCSGDAGILSGDICCAAECGECGGVGCSGRTGGAASCCTKDIDAAGEACSVKGASPCVVDGGAAPVTPTPEPIDATPEPTPEETPEPEAPGGAFSCSGDAGILQGDICCEASCGTCGGSGCSGRGNGGDSCCTANIGANGEVCSVKGAAPCIVDGDVDVTPTPEPVEPVTPTGFSCSGDAGIQQGDICCEASCGTCGGSGCSGRGDGQLSCCTLNIRAAGVTCSEQGAAPCIL